MTSLTVETVEVVENDHGRVLPETATITRPRPIEEIRQSIREVVDRADQAAEEYALDLVTALQVQARLAEDTGERISLEDFAVSEGFDLSQLRAE